MISFIAELNKQKVSKEARYHVPKLLTASIASIQRLRNWLTLARAHSLVFGHKIEEAKDLYIKVINNLRFYWNKRLYMYIFCVRD